MNSADCHKILTFPDMMVVHSNLLFWANLNIDCHLLRKFPIKKLSVQRNETETKLFQNSFETVLKLFCFRSISMYVWTV